MSLRYTGALCWAARRCSAAAVTFSWKSASEWTNVLHRCSDRNGRLFRQRSTYRESHALSGRDYAENTHVRIENDPLRLFPSAKPEATVGIAQRYGSQIFIVGINRDWRDEAI